MAVNAIEYKGCDETHGEDAAKEYVCSSEVKSR